MTQDVPDLRGLAREAGFRVTWDPASAGDRSEAAWLVRMPCHRGWIGVHGPGRLSAYAECQRRIRGRIARLVALPGVDILQRGDNEILVAFPVARLGAVAEVLGARRVRRLSPEHRAKLVAAGRPFQRQPEVRS